MKEARRYRPEFVDEILAADKSEPEAKFDNVRDMLDWLNRDERERDMLWGVILAGILLVVMWWGMTG